ncbi:hypothetical protein [Hydrogenoanaerobacterium saccharovorans]|uniref:hypothetical protein n=1 Tax=Hydrogenoanaerobacterium saccharovorans TaxID=474960 RepID=UPI000F5085FA|nr:hypothetical protein [Hydrogenoanaerobacterium saccharovorans]
MAFKIIRVNNKFKETRLYRLLEPEELPHYIGSSFWIEVDEQGAFWMYIMTLKEEGRQYENIQPSDNGAGVGNCSAVLRDIIGNTCQ